MPAVSRAASSPGRRRTATRCRARQRPPCRCRSGPRSTAADKPCRSVRRDRLMPGPPPASRRRHATESPARRRCNPGPRRRDRPGPVLAGRHGLPLSPSSHAIVVTLSVKYCPPDRPSERTLLPSLRRQLHVQRPARRPPRASAAHGRQSNSSRGSGSVPGPSSHLAEHSLAEQALTDRLAQRRQPRTRLRRTRAHWRTLGADRFPATWPVPAGRSYCTPVLRGPPRRRSPRARLDLPRAILRDADRWRR